MRDAETVRLEAALLAAAADATVGRWRREYDAGVARIAETQAQFQQALFELAGKSLQWRMELADLEAARAKLTLEAVWLGLAPLPPMPLTLPSGGLEARAEELKAMTGQARKLAGLEANRG